VIEQKPVAYEPPGEVSQPPTEPPTINVLASVRRRWYIVLVTAVVLCAAALPVIWLVIEPTYVVQGTVKVRPVVPGILTSEPSPTGIGGYGEFVNTQAFLLMNNNSLLQLVATALAPRNLSFLSGTPQNRIDQLVALVAPTKRSLDPERILRDAIAKKTITAAAISRTELIAVQMQCTNAEDAKAIVDCFLNTYVAQFGNAENDQGNQNLALLTNKLTEQQKVLQNRRAEINNLAEPYGTTSLTPLEEMKLTVQGRLMGELINLESLKIAAEANVELLKKTDKVELSPEQKVSLRREYVNSDPMVSELSKTIVSMERDLITQQALVKMHPRLSEELTA